MQRAQLEQWQTAKEMETLIHEFYESVPRDEAFARRIGLTKEMAEEYVPLEKLVRHLPSVRRARLLRKGHSGPDAELQVQSGEARSVQVTLAGASEQTYFNRQAALRRKPYFPTQRKAYNRRTG